MEKIKLFVVEDNKEIMNLIKESVSRDQNIFIIDTAANGQEFLEKIKNINHIDILLLDLIMPIMDGHLVMKEIKEKYSHVVNKIICMSAMVNDNILLSINNLEVADLFILKPFDSNALLQRLKDLMKSEFRKPATLKVNFDFNTDVKLSSLSADERNKVVLIRLENDITSILHDVGIPGTY